MTWVDYKKGYDMFIHSWIMSTMGMVGLADKNIGLVRQSINNSKTKFYADGNRLSAD